MICPGCRGKHGWDKCQLNILLHVLDAKYVKKRNSWRTLKINNHLGLWSGILWPHPMTMGGKTSYTVPMRHVSSPLGA